MALQLNLAKVKFSTQEVDVFMRPFNSEDRMLAIRSALGAEWDAYRSSDKVYAWKLLGGEDDLDYPWQRVRVTLAQEPGFFGRLLVSGVTRYLKGMGFELVGRIMPALVDRNTNLLDGRLSSPCDRRVAIHPVYDIDSFWKSNNQDVIDLMLLVRARTQWRLSIPVSELTSNGVNCTGLGTGLFLTGVPKELEHLAGKFVGLISKVNGEEVELLDPRDPGIPRVPANIAWPEGSRRSFLRYFRSRHAPVADQVWQQVINADSETSKPLEQLRRVRDLIKLLGQQPIALTGGLSAEVQGLLSSSAIGMEMATLPLTNFVFDYASKTKDTLASRGLRKYGPYDKSNPPVKNPRILVLCPKSYGSIADIFFKKFEHGCPYPDRRKSYHDFYGISKLFPTIGKAEFIFELFDSSAKSSIGTSYEHALLQRLGRTKDVDFCFVVTEEAHKELSPIEDPYCIVKSLLLAHAIPVSELTIEEMRADNRRLPLILMGMALQAYAKFGGVPFVLEAEASDKTELILGVGRADVGASRFGRKRVVGFATVFKSNGDYLIGAVRPFKDPDDYTAELSEVIEEGLREAIQREGMKPNTPIRLIFHVYKKPGSSKEIAALETTIKKFPEYQIDYAFVHVSDNHNWMVVDENDVNGVVPKGLIVNVTPYTRLINLIGPREYLGVGSPALLKVTVDRRSTYKDIDRLTAQVFDFAHVSWRGFNVSLRPVTIRYAQLAAELTGKLEQTAHWQPTMLTTFLKDKRWFL